MLKVFKTLGQINFIFCINFIFLFCNYWDHETAIYTQLQSDNGRHTKTGYDAKVSFVDNPLLEPMEVQEPDSTSIFFPENILFPEDCQV